MTRKTDWKKKHGEAIKMVVTVRRACRSARLDALHRLRRATRRKIVLEADLKSLVDHYGHDWGLGLITCRDCGRGVVKAGIGMLICPNCVTELSSQADRQSRRAKGPRAGMACATTESEAADASAPESHASESRELQRIDKEIDEIVMDTPSGERATIGIRGDLTFTDVEPKKRKRKKKPLPRPGMGKLKGPR